MATLNNEAVSIKGNTIVIDLASHDNETSRFIEAVSNEDFADLSLHETLKKAKLKLTPDMVGKTLVVIGGKPKTPEANISPAMKKLKSELKGNPHIDIILKAAELSEKNVFIRDDDHLTKLMGLPHNSVGGDFETGDDATTRDGDLKFYRKGSHICLGGGVKRDTIIKQGSGLVICWHPRDDNNHITEVSYLNIWDLVIGAKDELTDILNDYEENKIDLSRSFQSERFKIVRHTEDEDRFYIKSNAVRYCSVIYYTNPNYVKKTLVEHKAEQFLSSLPDENVKTERRSERKEITLEKLLKDMAAGIITLPDYQRETIINERLVDQFVGDSIMNGLQDIRGEFMFHHVGNKIYLVDGQQRLFNAVYNYFVKDGGTRSLSDSVKPLHNGLEVAGFTWKDFNDLAETNPEIKKFRDSILQRKFSVKHYYGYSQKEMANEYVVANRSTTMNRQELRAASPSALGKFIRFFTAPLWNCPEMRPATYISLRKLPIKIQLFDDFFVRRRKVLKKLNVSTDRMNMDCMMTKAFNWSVNWGKKTFKEDDNYLDALYESYESDEQVLKDWPKFTELFTQLTTAMNFLSLSGGYQHDFMRGDRRHRTKEVGVMVANKEEWDVIIAVISELKRKHSGKTLKITGDVISTILDHHYSLVVHNPNKKSCLPNNEETPYGLSTRVNSRTYKEVTEKWFPHWKDLLDANLIELKKLGFTFE